MTRFAILPVFLITAFWIVPASSLVIKTGNEVVIGADEIIDDDIVAMARTIKIEGKINGDVFAFGQEVQIKNIIDGSIYTGGSEISISTKDCRSLWAFCGSLTCAGNIQNNLGFFGGELKTDSTHLVRKDLFAFGGKVLLNGEIDGKVRGNMGEFILKGKAGNVNIGAKKVNIASDALVMEDLIIRSQEAPVIDPQARILGKTEFKKIAVKAQRSKRAKGIIRIFKTIFFISKIIIGLILIALFKPYIKRTTEILKDSTWRSLGIGFLTIIIIPVVTVITLITIIGLPIAIFGTFLFLTLAYVASIIFSTGFGNWVIELIKKDISVSPYLAFLLGFVVITLVCLIPYLGFFIRLVVFFFGTGMIVLLLYKLWKETKTYGPEK